MKKHTEIEQGTDAWFQIRKGKITGTTLKAIMKNSSSRQDAIYDIIAQRLTSGLTDDDENPMARGTRLEPDAIATFELQYGVQVERTGFCEDDTNSLIANSPDGLIGDTEAIEVKCPGGKNYVKMWLTNKVPDDYYWQVLQYFIVNEKLEKLYFVGYHPEIEVHPMHVIEVYRKDLEKMIIDSRKAQEAFLLEVASILKTIIKL